MLTKPAKHTWSSKTTRTVWTKPESSWPQARVTIVGADTAASVIFAREIKTAPNPDEVRAARIQEYSNLYENPYRGAERNYIDDVIMPHDTRKYINRCLDILENKSEARPWRKYSNINL